MKNKKILFVVNDPAFFLSHRVALALEAKKQNYDVTIATGAGTAVKKIEELGLSHREIPLSRSGKNPFSELKTLVALYQLFKSVKPDLAHLVTIKPVLYGGLVARLVGTHSVVAAISGLGSVFVATSIKRKLLKFLVLLMYKVSLGRKNIKVIFQNPDDKEILLSSGIVNSHKSTLIRGSGVDLSLCPVINEPEGSPIVVMAARLLKEKGVLTFVEAAKLLKLKNVDLKFLLVGAPDYGNPSSVTEQEINGWVDEGILQSLGFRNDIPEIFSKSHIIVLPSYYGEGLPKVLIEAAACGRPVITTDSPGCRDAIEKDITGILIPIKDPIKLANAIEKLATDKPLRLNMGTAGRQLAEREFRLESVVNLHMSIYKELLNNYE